MAKIFISFRNGDDPFAAALLYRALSERFGAGQVFRSSDSIGVGDRWEPAIWTSLRDSDVVVVVIGPRWLGITGSDGRPRLAADDDWVRGEVATALAGQKLVLPVFIEGAPRIKPGDLPADIAGLAELQSIWFSHRTIEPTVQRLADLIAAKAGGGRPAPASRLAAPWLDVWNVPPRPAAMADRDLALDRVRAAMAGGRPVVLHGPIGTGKSLLAAEYARRFAGDYASVWWVRPGPLAPQFSGLAAAAGFQSSAGDILDDLPALVGVLRQRGRILLVLDGFDDPRIASQIVTRLATADLLITSREQGWGLLAEPVRVDVFTRTESVALLGTAVPSAPRDGLDRLAEAAGDLPAAIGQAAVFLRDSGMSADEYVGLLAERTGDLLDRGDPMLGSPTLAAAWRLALERAAPAAADLYELVSVLAPAPVPLDLITDADPLARADLAKVCASGALIDVDGSTLLPGALFQAFVRHGTDPGRQERLRARARSRLAAAVRGEPDDPAAWPSYDVLIPHAIAADLASAPDQRARRALIDICRHLTVRAAAEVARTLIAAALDRWRGELSPDHPDLLDGGTALAQALYRLGRPDEALALDRDIAARHATRLGADHPVALHAAHNLAVDQWAAGIDRPAARTLLERVLADRTRVLGAGDPDTLRSAHNLALMRRAAGDVAGARSIDETTYRGLVAALGPDHPDTLRSGYALSLDLRALGDSGATALGREVFERSRATLGENHPETLRAGYACAVDLRRGGDPEAAYHVAHDGWERRRRALGDAHPDAMRSGYLAALLAKELGHRDGSDRLRQASAVVARLRTTGRVNASDVNTGGVSTSEVGPARARPEFGQ